MTYRHTIRVSLDPESLGNAVTALKRYRGSLETTADALAGMLAADAADTARSRAPGSLKSSISVDGHGGHYEVVADSDQALFNEFGTGVVGASHGYPYDLPDWWDGWDLRRTPEAHDEKDPTYWYYYPRPRGKVQKTRGMVATPFMGPAADEMLAQIRDLAEEVFKFHG